MAEFIMSAHAVTQALNMALEGPEIREAVLNPRTVSHPPGRGVSYRTRGKVTAVVTESHPPTVVTLLWATVAAWEVDYETTRSRDGAPDRSGNRRLRDLRKKQRRGKVT